MSGLPVGVNNWHDHDQGGAIHCNQGWLYCQGVTVCERDVTVCEHDVVDRCRSVVSQVFNELHVR